MKTLKEKDKQSFLARKEEVYSLIMEMGSLFIISVAAIIALFTLIQN